MDGSKAGLWRGGVILKVCNMGGVEGGKEEE